MENRTLLSTFLVNTTADSGPGSLRQAILDSDTAGGDNTIDFAVPGNGVRTISPISPLPAITNPVLIDGFSQPGYAGTPLIEVTAPSSGGAGALALGSNTTVRGLVVDGFAFGTGTAPDSLTVDSAPLPPIAQSSTGAIDTYRIDTATEARLVAQVQAAGVVTRLLLLDAQGRLLMQSDGQSPANPDDLIDLSVPPGAVSLEVQHLGGAGTYTLTTTLTPATAPFQPIPVTSQPSSIVTGDFTGAGFSAIATANLSSSDVSVILSNGDGSFQPAQTYAVGPQPGSIVAGDFTGNGILDLAVANFGNDTVSILMGNGNGTFQPARTCSVTAGDLVAGDFTGNGILDLAVADGSTNDVSVWLGNGDGTFRADGTYALGTGPRQIVAGDFTGNGILDLATANPYSENVSVLLGNGDGTFQSPRTYQVASPPASIVTGDFTGDGITDLATANYYSNNVSVLLGNGDGTFQPQRTYTVGSGPVFLVAGDFSGDGRTDLATANAGTNDVSVLLSNGDGTFQMQRTYTVGSYPYSLVTGDFTGDGRTDLATGNVATSDVSVLWGNGDGTFQTPVTNLVGSDPLALVSGDFTGDGFTDLATANIYSNDVSVLLGNGDGTFQPAVEYAVGTFPVSLVSGDFNGDGITDLATANYSSNNVSVLMGNGDGTFQPAVEYAVGQAPVSIVAGDFTGNGILDLAVANANSNDVSILLGNGDGTFKPAVEYAVGQGPDSIVAGDFTGDGHLDLAVANVVSNDVSVLMGNGDGTFQPQRTYSVGTQPWEIVTGDFTGNGIPDLAVANFGSNDVSILLGNGDGTFQPPRTYAVGTNPEALVAGDFSGDGIQDLAVANVGSNDVSVLMGNGDGSFHTQVTYDLSSGPTAIATGDFNGAGRTDLAIAESDNDVSVLLGNGDGTFADASQFVTTPHANPLVADLNGDGTDDVLVINSGGDILYRQGIPGQPGSFLPPVTINPGFPSRDIALLTTPGGPEVASVDAHDDAVSLYARRDGNFVRLGSLTTGHLPTQIVSADLNGDGWDDLVVRNADDGTLSVFFGTAFNRSQFVGPIDPQFMPPRFLAPVTLPVGVGVSDVQAVDTTGSGRLDLVVTNKLAGTVSVLRNLGNGTFAPPAPYRAGTGLSAIDDSADSPAIASLDATAGVAAGPFTTGGPTSLVTINPGSNTLDVLAGLGGSRYANPVTILTQSPPEVVRVADFTGTGIPDLAVLTASGVSIYLGNGKGGFSPPVNYDAGTDPTGLTIADLLGNGRLDLLVGDAEGDVLILVGNGDGTFRPFEPVKAAIALAVADLTGNGVPDFVFADQSLNRVTVVYGTNGANSTGSQVIADQSTGLLAPGAVKLADLTGDGIPDLIIANSGGNNVLVYPGLGNGQFGPPLNGTQGFAVGTDPTGLTVADLNGQPDLLVANTGSNDVSVLLGEGTGSSWTLIPGPRIQTDAGPVATVVGNLLGGSQTDLAVANSQADDVQVFPGVGGGFFNDQPQATKTFPVGQDPAALFLGNFSGLGLGLATLNAGSDNGTLISDPGSPNPVTQSFATGGERPTTGFAGDFTGNGFTDLVVGNNGDGHLALLLGGTEGLSLSQTQVSAGAPSPTGLSFAGVSNGVLSFYVSTAGREAALSLAFNLGGSQESEAGLSSGGIVTAGAGLSPAGVLAQATSGSVQQVAQLLSLTGSTSDLAATLVTVSVLPGNLDNVSSGGALASAATTGIGQGLGQTKISAGPVGSEVGPEDQAEGADPRPQPRAEAMPPWERLSIGLDQAWERARAAVLEHESLLPVASGPEPPAPPAVGARAQALANPHAQPSAKAGTKAPARPDLMSAPAGTAPIAPAGVSSGARQTDAIGAFDAALEDLATQRAVAGGSVRSDLGFWDELAKVHHPVAARAFVAVVASALAAGAMWRRRRVHPERVRRTHTHTRRMGRFSVTLRHAATRPW